MKTVINTETFEKSRQYSLDNLNFGELARILRDILIVCLELYSGFFAFVWIQSHKIAEVIGLNPTNELHTSLIYMVLLNLLATLRNLPFLVYKIFVLEEKHGFNKQSAGFFIKDQIKGFIVYQFLMAPILAVIIYVCQNRDEFLFVWLTSAIGALAFVIVILYPIYVAPIFDKYRPLEDGDLKTRIENLAASVHFPLGQIFVVEGSKRSGHSNAFFTGIWGLKRIVLFDTLLLNKAQTSNEGKEKGCTDDEVVAVLAHELGHWSCDHFTKYTGLFMLQILIYSFVFQNMCGYSALYESVGFQSGQMPVFIGVIILIKLLGLYHSFVMFCYMTISRRFEKQSDNYAIRLGHGENLGKALTKLYIDNLGFPIYDWMYSGWFHSHPHLLQRLENIRKSLIKEK